MQGNSASSQAKIGTERSECSKSEADASGTLRPLRYWRYHSFPQVPCESITCTDLGSKFLKNCRPTPPPPSQHTRCFRLRPKSHVYFTCLHKFCRNPCDYFEAATTLRTWVHCMNILCVRQARSSIHYVCPNFPNTARRPCEKPVESSGSIYQIYRASRVKPV